MNSTEFNKSQGDLVYILTKSTNGDFKVGRYKKKALSLKRSNGAPHHIPVSTRTVTPLSRGTTFTMSIIQPEIKRKQVT
jgi:hypothetical protein